MAKFAEDDRIEQMNAQKRRMKQLGEEGLLLLKWGGGGGGGGATIKTHPQPQLLFVSVFLVIIKDELPVSV